MKLTTKACQKTEKGDDKIEGLSESTFTTASIHKKTVEELTYAHATSRFKSFKVA